MSAQDVVYQAQSQVGYLEKKSNAYLENFTANAGNGNYTKYGAWFGLNPAEWCDMFVCWCADQAGEGDRVGQYAYVPSHVQYFKDRGQYFARGANTPQAGDVIFFEYGYDGVIDGDHVGLVEDCDGYNVHTIEGNTKNSAGIGSVMRHTYRLDYSGILGYGRPAYSGGGEKKELKVYNPWKTYRNGSTPEPVYRDTDMTETTGSLNPEEVCYCTGRYGNAYCVIYKLDGTADDWAVGYVKYNGGIDE